MSRTGGVPRPTPVVTESSAAFWDGAQRHELVIQRCVACGTLQYPPTVACERCRSRDLEPERMSGSGTVHSFAVVHQAMHAAFSDRVPYVLAFVELDEQPGLRLITNVVGSSPDTVRIGMPVQVAFDESDGWTIPVFEAAP